MHRLQNHLYTVACTLAGLLIIIGAVIVVRHGPSSPDNTIVAWGGSGTALLDPASYSPSNPVLNAANMSPSLGGTNPSFSAIAPAANPGNEDTSGQSDINALIASLSEHGGNTDGTMTVSGSSGGTLAYAFIPTGLISTTTATKTRTDPQQALYNYGNEVGEDILSYDNTHSGDTVILTNQAQDRGNPQKSQAVRDTGAALSALGEKIAGIESVPASAASMNADLAASYKDMGAKLALIPNAQRDEDFLKAITTYNGAVDTFTKQFVTLATFFSLNGVTFGQGDGGSAFTFSGAGSL